MARKSAVARKMAHHRRPSPGASRRPATRPEAPAEPTGTDTRQFHPSPRPLDLMAYIIGMFFASNFAK